MILKSIIDTGILTLYYSDDTPNEILQFFNDVLNKKQNLIVLNLIFVESFNKLCKLKGKRFAENCLINFQQKIPFSVIEYSRLLEFRAGLLKCQYNKQLSYVDCLLIASALINNATLHTTEKGLPEIPNIKVRKYQF